MKVKVTSFIPYIEDISGEYELNNEVTIEKLVNSLGLKWDHDALVVVNRVIVTDKALNLNDGDQVELLIPISGG
ncbi:hypothetical protein BKP35_11475 [Anaerobacillus arseniciselenatis]|uniref:Molybdopterin synthase sulfur carrier subunit n=1 Tax=Anaerobacillus arseniciselenatis TaxID=85682 RepID=A0A1S2LH64_9BACI|nr:MoaD/ThiS family protein [Anaerobacillus arseniciselenatis]OIJ11560.1 hypothetical protein BKP35_11475 [Anaerobacillus arseniciselenatis]